MVAVKLVKFLLWYKTLYEILNSSEKKNQFICYLHNYGLKKQQQIWQTNWEHRSHSEEDTSLDTFENII